jgi:hypothetical protein
MAGKRATVVLHKHQQNYAVSVSHPIPAIQQLQNAFS